MTDSLKKLTAAILALGPQEKETLLQTLLDALQTHSGVHETQPGVGEALQTYLVKGELPMEKQIRHLVERLNHLSPAKQAEVGDFIEFLHQRENEQLLRKDYIQASESAFAAIWDNGEDALYDKL